MRIVILLILLQLNIFAQEESPPIEIEVNCEGVFCYYPYDYTPNISNNGSNFTATISGNMEGEDKNIFFKMLPESYKTNLRTKLYSADNDINISVDFSPTKVNEDASSFTLISNILKNVDIKMSGLQRVPGKNSSDICAQNFSSGVYGEDARNYFNSTGRDVCNDDDSLWLEANKFSCPFGYVETDDTTFNVTRNPSRRKCGGELRQRMCIKRTKEINCRFFHRSRQCCSGIYEKTSMEGASLSPTYTGYSFENFSTTGLEFVHSKGPSNFTCDENLCTDFYSDEELSIGELVLRDSGSYFDQVIRVSEDDLLEKGHSNVCNEWFNSGVTPAEIKLSHNASTTVNKLYSLDSEGAAFESPSGQYFYLPEFTLTPGATVRIDHVKHFEDGNSEFKLATPLDNCLGLPIIDNDGQITGEYSTSTSRFCRRRYPSEKIEIKVTAVDEMGRDGNSLIFYIKENQKRVTYSGYVAQPTCSGDECQPHAGRIYNYKFDSAENITILDQVWTHNWIYSNMTETAHVHQQKCIMGGSVIPQHPVGRSWPTHSIIRQLDSKNWGIYFYIHTGGWAAEGAYTSAEIKITECKMVFR
jgi:hypothetical protein